jgi:hypothetical protein
MLLASLVWREWIGGDTLKIGYAALGVVWLLAWWQSRTERRNARIEIMASGAPELAETEKRRSQMDQMFREAQQRYLENDWVAAEQLLLILLKQDARDVEARLMLSTLWRHQGRLEEAGRQLDRLERLEAAGKWRQEIAAERERLKPTAVALPERAETETIDSPTESALRRRAA